MIWTGREETSWGFQPGEEAAPGLTVLSRLGGGEYEVYLATDLDDREVVVKLVRPHMVEETYPLEGLRREAEVLSALDHPAVVKLLTADIAPPRPHLLLDHCAGDSLAEADVPVSLEDAASIGHRLASVIAYISGEGFVHLDLKPHNVIVGEELRLIDFGIARRIVDAARLRSPAGTDAYMAPEQCKPADATVGPAADVWGLGATAFFALTGRAPFPRRPGAPTGTAGRWPQLSAPFSGAGELPLEVRELIASCLDKDPARRPTAAEVAAGFGEIA